MGIRCRDCSRLYDSEAELDDHDCDGDNVTILIIKPSRAKEVGDNPARVFESREDAKAASDATNVPTRMTDAPLIAVQESEADTETGNDPRH